MITKAPAQLEVHFLRFQPDGQMQSVVVGGSASEVASRNTSHQVYKKNHGEVGGTSHTAPPSHILCPGGLHRGSRRKKRRLSPLTPDP